MEIETKYAVPNVTVFEQLSVLDELAGLPLAEPRTVTVHDCYIDTADLAFMKAGYSCRIRNKGGVVMATIKSLAGASGALHSREEYETVIEPGTGLHPDSWPDGEAAEVAGQFSRGQKLEMLVELFQERRTRALFAPSVADPVVELSLDAVVFGGSGEAFYELEAEERIAGQAALLARLDEVLAGEWDLLPQPLSKFERALQLARPDVFALLPRG